MSKEWLPDKSLMKDAMNRPLTQGLFLELNYGDFAYYTLKDDDYEYKGKLYKSLKKLYLESRDPTEYDFATKYLLGWEHWRRICANAALRKEIVKWREELELAIRSQAIAIIQDIAERDDNFQAAKFLADRGWEKNGRGRPSKEDVDRHMKVNELLNTEFDDDFNRVQNKVAH